MDRAGRLRARASFLAAVAALVVAMAAGGDAAIAASAPTTTTTPAVAVYEYDSAAPNAQSASVTVLRTSSPLQVRSTGTTAGRFGRSRSVDFLAAKAGDEAVGGVYSLRDEAGNVVRTGRSKDLARREAEHARDPALGQYRFQPEYRTDDYGTQRGLEQLLHDEWLPPLNKIRPISERNPRIEDYVRAGREFRARP